MAIDKVYKHWADVDMEWNNNILSPNKSDYFEGEVIPHSFVYTASKSKPLVKGETYSFNITYNYYQQNTNAGGFAYITTYNIDRDPSALVTEMPKRDGSFSNGGGFVFNGDPMDGFYTVNADITAVSNVTYKGARTKDGYVTVTFVYTGETTSTGFAEIYYGLYVAEPGRIPDQGKGTTSGATAWTGGSLQTTVDIGGSGATSIQLMPSAIIAGEISGMKFNDINGDGTRDADGIDNIAGNADDEAGLAGWTIFLDTDNDGTLDPNEEWVVTGENGVYSFSVTPDANKSTPTNDGYIVREVSKPGWMQTTANPAPIVISALDPTEHNVNFGNMLMDPKLSIEKTGTFDAGADGFADPGELVTYSFAVDNIGNVSLSSVQVTDPLPGMSAITYQGGDTDGDDHLDVNETWTYSATYAVTQADIDAGKVYNLATADSDESPPDSDDEQVMLPQNPLLAIEKTGTFDAGADGYADPGELVTYSFAVDNIGNVSLSNVQVTDPLPGMSAITYQGGDTDGDDHLDVNETWTYSATYAVTQADIDAGKIYNLATADSDESPPDSDDEQVMLPQNPLLAIEKTGTFDAGADGYADPGELVTYSFAVDNIGNVSLSNVQVTDPLPGMSAITYQGGDTDGDDHLDVNETWTYSATYAVTQADIDAGKVYNLATADSYESPPDSDDEQVMLPQNPLLAIEKTGTFDAGADGFADPGELVTYSFAVDNIGNVSLSNVQVTDPLPGMSAITYQGGDTDGDDHLDVNETWTYSATYAVTQADIDAGKVYNLATADSDESPPDSDDEQVTLPQNPLLAIEKTILAVDALGNSLADRKGDIVDYNVRVTNAGNVTLTGVTVADPLTGLGQAIGTLAPGEYRDFQTQYAITQTDLNDQGGGDGDIDNTASADSNETDAVTSSTAFGLVYEPTLSVKKVVVGIDEDGNGLLDKQGDVVDYEVVLKNTGNITLTGVSVADPVTGLMLDDLTLLPGESFTTQTSYAITQNDLDTNAGGDGNLDNAVTADSDQTDPVVDSEDVGIIYDPLMVLAKVVTSIDPTGNKRADTVGDLINYALELRNEGNVTITGIALNDSMATLTRGLDTVGNDDNILDVGEIWSYTATYALTQDDIDGRGTDGLGYIENVATATSTNTAPATATAKAGVAYVAALSVDKTVKSIDLTGDQLANKAGDVIVYNVEVLNNGNVTLTGISVFDPLTGQNETNLSLAPGQSFNFESFYTIKQYDLDSKGIDYLGIADGDGDIDNMVTVDSNETAPQSDSVAVGLAMVIL